MIISLKKLFSVAITTLILTISYNAFSEEEATENINEYHIMTESYPPFNFQENGNLKGLSVEILDLVLKGVKADINSSNFELLPWARAYVDLQKKNNSMLFSMTRTDERENLFKWVGPIAHTKIALVALKDKKIKINNIKELNNFKIGVVRTDVGESLLLSNNIAKQNISAVAELEQNVKKIATNRIDIISYEENVLKWTMKKNGENPNNYETVYALKEGQIYYAFNKNTPDELIKELQNSFDKVKQSKEYQDIINKYLN